MSELRVTVKVRRGGARWLASALHGGAWVQAVYFVAKVLPTASAAAGGDVADTCGGGATVVG